ncbi:T9SS type A sorting domain-containing protein [Aestuariibaculum sp. YM273]|uniref:T9SS type A sorting domain-containing protein n=1 Tax=Aestuariibaculum sp. YM273 TaxID=3070659 RepID=UPI0027DBFF1E|nr:T9SS type A sorting domain-containing protein [Aestuariibaculum sp. YM273]WMI65850.1 T9SS type A sorting domain-containing protein [Aestuariibaculum sp. YM273]
MAKFYSSIFVFLFINLSQAQITLTSATHTPKIGDSFEYIYNEDYTFDVSQSGANQTWDFSTATGTSQTANYIDLASSSDPTTYAQSNVVATSTIDGFYGETYYISSSSGLSAIGQYSPNNVKVIYTDPREGLKFPISYGDTFNETFSGTKENLIANQTYDENGTIEITADGYGDLILPYTTITNVLKIKMTSTYTDVLQGLIVLNFKEVSNIWYDINNNAYLASTTEVYSEDQLVASYAYYLSQSDLILNTTDFNNDKNFISIYPNPANNILYIENKSNESLEIQFIDITGRTVKRQFIGLNTNEVPIDNIQSGIYNVAYYQNNTYHTKRVIVK